MQATRSFNTVFQDSVPNSLASDSRTSSIFERRTYTRVIVPTSEWMKELQKRFDVLTSLPVGWDGYGGRPVTFSCANFAANLVERLYLKGVPEPQLVPGSDGTVQLEWHRNQFDVEIDVLAPYEVTALRRDLRNGVVEELELQTDFTLLTEWIDCLRDISVTPQTKLVD